MVSVDDLEVNQGARTLARARLTFAFYPLAILVAILAAPLPFAYVHLFNYRLVMPDILAISSVVVMFVGAFWDFGAKLYVRQLVDNKIAFGDDDLAYVFKQQFILTLIYLLIGVCYFIVAILIYAF